MNNAGIGRAGPIEWTPMKFMKQIADVNLWGMIDVTKTFLPLIKKSQGRVVNLSSMAGEFTGVMGTLTEKKMWQQYYIVYLFCTSLSPFMLFIDLCFSLIASFYAKQFCTAWSFCWHCSCTQRQANTCLNFIGEDSAAALLV